MMLLASAADAEGRGGRDLLSAPEADPAWRAALAAEARAMPFSKGLLFRITALNGKTSWLLGTLHAADARVSEPSPLTREALARAGRLLLELDPETKSAPPADMRAALLAPDDRQAARLLPFEDYVALVNRFGNCNVMGLPVERLKPFAIALVIDDTGCRYKPAAGGGLDAALARLARENGVPVTGLETLIEQIDLGDGLPPEVDGALLAALLRRMSRDADIEETEIRRYLDRDPGGLLAWMRAPQPIPGVEGSGLPPKFLDRLLSRRNRRLAERATPFLVKGNVLLAIGAAHVAGADGVAQLLEDLGFRVEAME
jgi:uncharacterized protein YbaP (TraB family)